MLNRIKAAGLALSLAACALVFGLTSATRAAAATPAGGVDACSTAPPGQAHCLAQILVSKRTGRVLRPHVRTIQRSKEASSGASTGRSQSEPVIGAPQWFQQAYDTGYLSKTRGVGDTIAVVDAYNDSEAASDLAVWRKAYGLPACTVASGCFRQLNQSGQASPLPSDSVSWQAEEALDLDAASTLCPNCKLILVEANSQQLGDLLAADQAAAAAGANQISDSWTAEFPAGPFPSDLQLSITGASVLAAAGDDGTIPADEEAYPAALPNVTAVGGTTLVPTSKPTSARGFTERAWYFSGAGCDVYESTPTFQPSTGCSGRAYNDVSAAANPNWGLNVFDRGNGGWLTIGGTSLASPLVAGFEAITQHDTTTPAWAYVDNGALDTATPKARSGCTGALSVLCGQHNSYYGPIGAGSISAAGIAGPPQITGPVRTYAFGLNTETLKTGSDWARVYAGVYPNGSRTKVWIRYGAADGLSRDSRTVTVDGTAAQGRQLLLRHLKPGTTYRYQILARNRSGITRGYTFTLRTRDVRTKRGTRA